MKYVFAILFLFLSIQTFSQNVQVSGRCYYDVNKNNIYDGVDSALTDAVVEANFDGGGYLASTDENGMFYFSGLDTGTYSFIVDGNIDLANYEDVYQQLRSYHINGISDTVDFPIQPRDSISTLLAYFENAAKNVPYTGGTRQYKLTYGYDGFLQSMPASLVLNFNPKLIFIDAAPAPDVTSGGRLQWNFPDLQRNNVFGSNPFDSIILNFRFPEVGDTIGAFILSPNLIPGIEVTTTNAYIQVNDFAEQIDFPFTERPTGNTNGVKWLRHFKASANGYYDALSIDTTQDGNGYFIAGQKPEGRSTLQLGQPTPFIAKLNKDGLSVWEQYLFPVSNNFNTSNVTAIKHTPDGGCIALAYSTMIDSMDEYNYDNAIVIKKIDSSGKLQWTKRMNGSRYDQSGESIVVLQDGSFVFTGSTSSFDGDFLNNNADTLNNNIFITKLSAAGNVIFTKIYGGSGNDNAHKIIPLQNNSFLVLATTDSYDGDIRSPHQHFTVQPNGRDTIYSEEAWVLNIDANGNIIWNRCYGGSKDSYLTGAAENNGDILLTGLTNSKNGDLPWYPEAFVPLWAIHISPAGNIISSKLHKLYRGYQDTNYLAFPSEIFDNYILSRLHKTTDGNFVAAGITTDKYGTIKTSHGHGDFVFVKLDVTGDIIWQKAAGGTKSDYVNDIQTDSNNDIVFVGNTNSENDDLYQHSLSTNRLMVTGKIGITNRIKGTVFIDNNGNHFRDAGEAVYSQGTVISAKRTDTLKAAIFTGNFLNIADTGSYISTFKPANNYYTVYPATYNSNFATADLQDSVNFALTPLAGINDLQTVIVPLSVPVTGGGNTYRIITKNVGTTSINNVVVGLKKDSRQTYVSASRTRTGIQADSIWWGPFTLNANSTDTLNVLLNSVAAPALNNGDTLSLTATANPLLNDSTAAGNIFRLRQLLNDSAPSSNKSEIHAGAFSTTQYNGGEYLQYLLRFQNTGTDTAFYITIKDTLQPGLDLNTLEVVTASHAYTFRLNGNIATWDFNKIKLPGMTINQAASRGYLLFKIKPKANFNGGDEFNNKAAIYFDYNLPFITNEENTKLGAKEGACPNENVFFTAGVSGSSYQWQVNMGAGFINLSNNNIYSGVTTNTLTLTSPPTSMYGYVYRAVVNGNIFGNGQTLKFSVRWNGSVSTAWENANNWDCSIVPDAKTEVTIPVSARYPLVSTNAACYSLRLSPGSLVTIKTGAILSVEGKAN